MSKPFNFMTNFDGLILRMHLFLVNATCIDFKMKKSERSEKACGPKCEIVYVSVRCRLMQWRRKDEHIKQFVSYSKL